MNKSRFKIIQIFDIFLCFFYRHLSKNKISKLSEEEFSNLKQLKRLWLNENDLSQIPTHIFKSLPNIEAL